MPNQTRQQVADQLNKLTSQGASEQKILDYVAGAGYVPDDFNADLNGSFRPMVVGTGTLTTNYTAAEAKESQQYFENLAASSSTVTPKPTASTTSASTTTKTVTTTEITNFQQTTGGGTTTVFSTPAVSTPASLEYKAQADQAYNLQQAYASNPNSTFGQKTLDRKLAAGTITQAQYNEIKNLSPEDRRAKTLEYNAQYETARTNEIATQAGGQPVVVVTPSQNNSAISVNYQKSTSTSSTTLNGAVGGTNITTETVEGVTYQVVNNADGTKSYTPADSPDLAAARATSVTIANNNPTPQKIINPNTDPNTNIGAEGQDTGGYTPLQEPPITNDGDEFSGIDEQVQRQKDLEDGSLEFAGIDEQIALNENALQEPPLLTDEEVDELLQNIGAEGQDVTGFEPLTEPPITNDGDEFSGIDEQVQRQKDLEDGSLEFAGIDEQIAANENTLQEPPLLSDEEIEQQLRLAAAQEETIAPQKEVDEFDGIDAQIAANKAQADGLGPDALDQAPWSTGSSKGLQGAIDNTQSQATAQDQANFQAFDDWRVRLSLAPNADYLYRAPVAGILAPLAATDGVLFPYTPVIAVTYAASYEPTTITHSNYKIFQYNSSSVDQVSITCDFTAQDTYEANYLLAVIHFFRSMTKMFYGQDENPKPGTPPPLCYLFGLGGFQFEAHPLAVTGFSYNLPNDVDYIQASSTSALAGVQVYTGTTGTSNNGRLGTQARPGGTRPPAQFQNNSAPDNPTYVPTKIQLAITCVPIISRNQISNKFSLTDYATGALLQGTKRQGGGIW